ncbi:M16 family metallopeptidase [Bacteroidota bacterium]
MKYRFIQLIIFLLVSIVLSAQIDRSKAPEPGPAPVIKVGEYKSFELKNGLKVFVVENHKIPRVSYSLLLDMDPFTEGDSIGYTSIAGAMLGTATTTRTKDQIDEEIDFIGATLNTSAGSVSGAALKKHNEKLLELMSDVLLNPVFNQDELDKLKKQTISDLAYGKSDPSYISGIVTSVLLYGKDHPYGEVTTEASVESITLDMCEEFNKTYFRPNIAYLAIVGDINLKEAKKLCKKYFGEWEPAEVPGHQYSIPQAPDSRQVSIVDRPHAIQSVVKVAHPVKYTVGTKDYVEARVMNLLLGGSATARLFMNLREDHAYTYGCYSNLNNDKWIGSFQASADVKNEVTDSAVYQILYEMDRIQTEIASVEEVDNIKKLYVRDFCAGTRAAWYDSPICPEHCAIWSALGLLCELPEIHRRSNSGKCSGCGSEIFAARKLPYFCSWQGR